MTKQLKLISVLICVCLAVGVLLSFAGAAPLTDSSSGTGRICRSHPGPLMTLAQLSKTASIRNNGPMRAPSLQPAVVDLPLLVIVVGFKDLPYSDTFDWSESVFENDRSLSEFYSDMSFGQFTFTPAMETSSYGNKNTNKADTANDGIIHVSLSCAHDDWTLEYPFLSKKDIATNRTLCNAMISALTAADEFIDYSAYDVNTDGAITTDELALGFVFAGYEASSSVSYKHGNAAYLWSHAYSLQELKDDYDFDFALPSPDGVTVNSYIAISEREDDDSQEPAATIAHELGHYLGLPDLYDTDYNTSLEWGQYNVDCLSLMCMNEWSDPVTGEKFPTPLDAWSKVALGWVTPAIADSSGVYSLTSHNYELDSGCDLIRIPTQNPDEYYLLENRTLSKWDAPMTGVYDTENGGVILWHIDDSVYDLYHEDNSINNTDHRPAVMPLFPEVSSNGTYTFTGKNKKVLTVSPFFDLSVWNEKYTHLGNDLNLPVYGTGSEADSRAARTLSGIKLRFLSDAGEVVKIMINPDEHIHHARYVEIISPGCTETGLAYYECVLCEKRFTDEACENETSEPFAVDALGHTAPDSNGTCGRCGAVLVSDDQICPYCHKYHDNSFIQRLIAFFHRILYFFSHLFG